VYPIQFSTFNYAPIALGIVLGAVMGWWIIDARHWFKGPVREIFGVSSGKETSLPQ
jgi:hypothetical protein